MRIEDKRAVLLTKHFTGSFDCNHPHLGVQVQNNNPEIDIRQAFSFLVPEPPSETYVRGNDFVAKYPARNSDLVSYTTYYSIAEADIGIDFTLSAQTSLLDSNPTTKVNTLVGPSTVSLVTDESNVVPIAEDQDYDLTSQANAFLIRPTNNDTQSIVLLVHPSDYCRATVRLSNHPELGFWVFPNSLEKGVIRRATFMLRIVSRDGDEQRAQDIQHAALQQEPPLTA